MELRRFLLSFLLARQDRRDYLVSVATCGLFALLHGGAIILAGLAHNLALLLTQLGFLVIQGLIVCYTTYRYRLLQQIASHPDELDAQRGELQQDCFSSFGVLLFSACYCISPVWHFCMPLGATIAQQALFPLSRLWHCS